MRPTLIAFGAFVAACALVWWLSRSAHQPPPPIPSDVGASGYAHSAIEPPDAPDETRTALFAEGLEDSAVAAQTEPPGEGVRMEGRVVDELGTAVPGVELALVDAGDRSTDVVSDANGRFAVSVQVVDGRARRPVEARSRSAEWRVDRFFDSEAGEAVVRVHRTGRVLLRVVDRSGDPVPEFVATVIPIPIGIRIRIGEYLDGGSTRGERGVAELAVSAGRFHVLLSVPGRIPEWVSEAAGGDAAASDRATWPPGALPARIMEVPRAGRVTIEHRLSPAKHSVTLDVKDAAGRALAGVAVTPAVSAGQLALVEGAPRTDADGRLELPWPDSQGGALVPSFRFEHAELGTSVRWVPLVESGAATVTLVREPKDSDERVELQVASGSDAITCTPLGLLGLPIDRARELPAAESTFLLPGLYRLEATGWSRILAGHPGSVHAIPTPAASLAGGDPEVTEIVLEPDPGARYEAPLPVVYREDAGDGVSRFRELLGAEPLTLRCNANGRSEVRVGGRLAPSTAFLPIVLGGRGAKLDALPGGKWQVPATQRLDVRCSDSSGLPMADLVVEVWGDYESVELVTDAEGAAVFFAVPGRCAVQLGGLARLASTWVTVDPGVDIEVALTIPRQPASLRGTVIGSDLSPLRAAAIVASPLTPAEDGLRPLSHTFLADDDGRFLADSLMPGPYRIEAFPNVEDRSPLVSEELVLSAGEERTLVLSSER